jgi:hypothetical protein
MTLKDALTALLTANTAVTVFVIGGGEYAGTLTSVGNDFIVLDQGTDVARSIIPFSAISCVLHR